MRLKTRIRDSSRLEFWVGGSCASFDRDPLALGFRGFLKLQEYFSKASSESKSSFFRIYLRVLHWWKLALHFGDTKTCEVCHLGV